MRKPKILVVGSFVMDQIATTRVFPREGQTVLGEAFSKAPGGKGANQAVQAARLGADVTMIGKVGRDSNGEELVGTCREAGITVDQVLYDETASSGCSVIVLEKTASGQTQNRIIVISGSNMTIRPEELTYLEDQIANYDLVMLQLEIPMEINEMVADMAHRKGVPVMLNSAPSAPLSDHMLSCLTFISPNEHEAADLTGIRIERDENGIRMDQVEQAAKALNEKGVEHVLITLGSSGAALYSGGQLTYSPCIPGVPAVDPTAAGDSFVGAFCVGYCCGWDWTAILRFANHTATLTVSRMGAMPSLPTLEEVERAMTEMDGAAPDTAALQ